MNENEVKAYEEKVKKYKDFLKSVYTDGVVNVSERSSLEALKKELGLTTAECQTFEKPFLLTKKAQEEDKELHFYEICDCHYMECCRTGADEGLRWESIDHSVIEYIEIGDTYIEKCTSGGFGTDKAFVSIGESIKNLYEEYGENYFPEQAVKDGKVILFDRIGAEKNIDNYLMARYNILTPFEIEEEYVHEYTHLWDRYTQNTNPELWQKGKDILSKTHLWQEVKADPNYQDIADDDDLVLSEVHSRICDEIAQKVLERIAEQDGEITKDKVINWDKEVFEYIGKEFGKEFSENQLFHDNYDVNVMFNFLSQPMKDLMQGKSIQRNKQNKTMENENFIKENISDDQIFEWLKDAHYKTDNWDFDVVSIKNDVANLSAIHFIKDLAKEDLSKYEDATSLSEFIDKKMTDNNMLIIPEDNANYTEDIEPISSFARELWNNNALQEYVKNYAASISTLSQNRNLMEINKAKDLIEKFVFDEYMSTPDFDNLHEIGIAYTEYTDPLTKSDYSVQVNVNLIEPSIVKIVNGIEVSKNEYESLKDLNALALSGLDFDELVYISSGEEEIGLGKKHEEIENQLLSHVNKIFEEKFDGASLVTKAKLYNPSDYGFEKDNKIHILFEVNSNEREDDLFNVLAKEGYKLSNGVDVDFNPITPREHGSIDEYLESLQKGYEKELQIKHEEKVLDSLKTEFIPSALNLDSIYYTDEQLNKLTDADVEYALGSDIISNKAEIKEFYERFGLNGLKNAVKFNSLNPDSLFLSPEPGASFEYPYDSDVEGLTNVLNNNHEFVEEPELSVRQVKTIMYYLKAAGKHLYIDNNKGNLCIYDDKNFIGKGELTDNAEIINIAQNEFENHRKTGVGLYSDEDERILNIPFYKEEYPKLKEKFNKELDSKMEAKSVTERYVNFVKKILHDEDMSNKGWTSENQPVEKILVAAQKALSSFSNEEKAEISKFLLSKGAKDSTSMGNILRKSISDKKSPQKERDERTLPER